VKIKEVTLRSLHSFQKTLLLFFCQMEGPDRDLIAKAHAFYEKQDIHPFTVMDVMPYPPKARLGKANVDHPPHHRRSQERGSR